MRVLRSICAGTGSIDEIAKVTDLSTRTIYRLTDELVREGMVKREGGPSGTFLIGNDLRATALSDLLNSKAHPDDVIVGSKLLIVLSLSQGNKKIERIAMETGLAVDTVKALTWRLRGYGALFKKGGYIGISPTDDVLIRFAQDMSRGVCQNEMQGLCQNGRMIWNGGLQFIFSANDVKEGSVVEPTGLSATDQFGLRFIAKTGYFHWAYWHPILRREDIALHVLMTGPRSTRTIGHSMLLLKHTGYDKFYLRSEANLLGMSKLVGDVIAALEGKEVKNPFVPKGEEMADLYNDYGVV